MDTFTKGEEVWYAGSDKPVKLIVHDATLYPAMSYDGSREIRAACMLRCRRWKKSAIQECYVGLLHRSEAAAFEQIADLIEHSAKEKAAPLREAAKKARGE